MTFAIAVRQGLEHTMETQVQPECSSCLRLGGEALTSTRLAVSKKQNTLTTGRWRQVPGMGWPVRLTAKLEGAGSVFQTSPNQLEVLCTGLVYKAVQIVRSQVFLPPPANAGSQPPAKASTLLVLNNSGCPQGSSSQVLMIKSVQ